MGETNTYMEEQAAEKWCPFGRTRSNDDGVVSYNRTSQGDEAFGSRCLGRKCMMFRQVDTGLAFYYCGLARGA